MNSSISDEKDYLNEIKHIDINKYKLTLIMEECDIKVFKAIDKVSKKIFMIRQITIKNEKVTEILKKMEILISFKSPFVLKNIGYDITDHDNDFKILLVLSEYPPNLTLDKFIYKNEWDETQKLIVIYGIALGIAYLHSKNIIFYELTLNNIYLDEYLLPKIGFCDAFILNYDIEFQSKGIGIFQFCAPEILNEEEYDQSVDIYSFAVCVYIIISGSMPRIPLKSKMTGKKPEFNEKFSQPFKDLLNDCFDIDRQKRPTFEEIVYLLKEDKRFITNGIDENKFHDFIDTIENNGAKFKFEKVNIKYPIVDKLLVDSDPINLDMYEKLQFIGKGQFGKIFLAKEKSTQHLFAAKINIRSMKDCDYIQINNISREINILSKLNNPSILKFIGYSQNDFKNKAKPTIITEFGKNKSLDDIINFQIHGLAPNEWNDTKILITTYGIAYGMAYLHSKNILHRDLKPANVFFDEYLFPKIGDFGLSKEIGDDSYFESYNHIGTLAFMSPEILCDYDYSKAGDVYAFGVLLYQMITLEKPFKNLSFFQLLIAIMNNKRPEFNVYVPNCYKKLIEKCWHNDAEKRPTFNEIVDILENDDEFITENIDNDEYADYREYVKKNEKEKITKPIIIDFEKLRKEQQQDTSLNVTYLNLNKYRKEKLINKINNFKIYEIKNIRINKSYEAKISILSITNISQNDLIHLSREINILSKLDHPLFLKFIGYSPVDFKNRPNPVIVTEMPPNQSLNQLLKIEKYQEHIKEWNDTKKLINIYGIANGMQYLHSHNIIHRNLTTESIFLDDFLFPKIGNFGLLTKIHTEESMTFQTSVGIKGDYFYSSPELLEFNTYSFSSDVYAFAFIVYEIITENIPFDDIRDFKKLYKEVVNKSSRPQFNDKIEPQYRQLIEVCWAQNPDDRPSFEQISSILKNDCKFITNKINKEEFYKYIEFIEKSQINYFSNNQVVKFNELLEEKRSNDKIDENTKNVIKHIDNTTRNTLIKEENNLNKKMSKKEAVQMMKSIEKEPEEQKEKTKKQYELPKNAIKYINDTTQNILINCLNLVVEMIFIEDKNLTKETVNEEMNREIEQTNESIMEEPEKQNTDEKSEKFNKQIEISKVKENDTKTFSGNFGHIKEKENDELIFKDTNKTIEYQKDKNQSEKNNMLSTKTLLDTDKNEIIEKYINAKQTKQLMEFLNDKCDEETVLSVFDRCFNESPDIYSNLCKEGILMNNAIAHHKYALTLILSPNANKSSIEEAEFHLKESIKKGFLQSYFTLARLLHECFKKDNEAIEILQKGSEKGDKYSMCLLGYYISRGIGTEKVYKKGISMILQSGAEDFYQLFSTDIGVYYSQLNKESNNQEDKIKYSQKAFEFFEKAYNLSKTTSTINNYSICYMIGFGVHKNIEKAKEILINNDKKNDSNLLYHLGYIYEKINLETSYNYYREAAKQGNVHAQSRLDFLQNKK